MTKQSYRISVALITFDSRTNLRLHFTVVLCQADDLHLRILSVYFQHRLPLHKFFFTKMRTNLAVL